MKREDIIKASFEYKREVELIEGNFHSNINLNSVAVAFREGVGWFIDSVWHDKKVRFSHITSTEPEERIYVTVGGKCWAYCIPFGEETADLVGSACDYEENE